MKKEAEEKLDQAVKLIQEAKEIEYGPDIPDIKNIRAEQTGTRQITVYWTGGEGPIDIEFYSADEQKWKHSANKYGHDIDASQGGFSVNFNPDSSRGEKYFRIVQGNWTSKAVIATLVPQKPDETETITIIDNKKEEGFEGWYVGVNGILKIGSKWRVYFQDRTHAQQVVYSESEDLKTWTPPRMIGTTKNLSFVQHGGQVYAYGEDEDHMCIWKSEDGINHFSGRVQAFEWKLDTIFTFYFHQDNGQPRMFGRVRGNGIGGWESGPERRGISYHKAESIDSRWESRILADPMDFFDYDKDLAADFYQPCFRPDGTGEIIIYWRDKKNKVSEYDDGTRITGPIYPVKARYDDGEIKIDSFKPAVDISQFITGEIQYNDLTVYETGQIYIHPRKIEYEGKTFRMISYREDEHYRVREDSQQLTGIYLVSE